MQRGRFLDEKDLEKLVEKLLETLAKQNPELKAEIEKNKAELIKEMTGILKDRKDGLTTMHVGNPAFIKALAVTAVCLVSMNKAFAQNMKLLDPSLMKKLQDIFSDPKKLAELHMNPKALEKMLKPEELKQLREAITNQSDKLINDMEKSGLIKPTPDKDNKGAKEEMAKGFDPYENLFGLANSYVTGSIPTVVQSYVGNGVGFPDWNPNNGLANIDRQNSTEPRQDDSLALNASTMGNFLQLAGDSLLTEFQQDLRESNLAASSTPRPHGPGEG